MVPKEAAPNRSPDDADEEMPDAPASGPIPQEDVEDRVIEDEQQAAEQNDDRDDDQGDNPEEDDEEEEAEQNQTQEREPEGDEGQAPTEPSTPLPESEEPSRQDTPSRTPGRVSALTTGPRRRRPGRPPKNRPPDWEAPEAGEPRSDASGPPRRRGRGRPSAGGRWGKSRGGPSHVTQVPVDKEGNMMNVVNDEVDLPEDPEGETKVDKLGNLLGGREYRVRTFTILDRGERQYMLSTEPARCIGFRDSYLFFQKHKLLYKIIIDDDAKRNLIERQIIPHSYKGRAIGVVTARSVFREFGAKIVIGGRKIIDEYNVKAARERGDVEGELAVPDDILPGPGETYDRNRYVAWHGASSVYHSGAPSVPMPAGKTMDARKKKVIVTGDNWMIEHARATSTFNSSLANARRKVLNGVYDIHTNAMLYPKDMQPCHIRVERVTTEEENEAERSKLIESANRELRRLRESTDEAPMINGAATENDGGDSDAIVVDETENPDENAAPGSTSIFRSVPPRVSRHFAVQDIYFETPPYTALGAPGPNGSGHSDGLVSVDPNTGEPVFNMDTAILKELPPECREAYIDAAMKEWEWKKQFTAVGVNRGVSRPKMGFSYLL
ncbi:chromatin structure-remodeling complex subunit RSC7 [Emydomyces testavorans]|uniref:Chromatin structure-remodeling complex subunit RSC7 n=1 Tax=Emydomyces testavorans TaxID=2070801 RepID=A0AAF0DB75_9EURO|nr:chromatin structure-remodeling complex subunit RSC7 [Emydomyces testavorans]